MKKYATFLVAFAAFLWSLDALLRKPLVDEISAGAIVFYEHLFGVILLSPLLIKVFKSLKGFNGKDWLSILFIAIGGSALATYFFTASFNYVSPSVSILLQKIQPIFAISLAAIILKEVLSKRFFVWVFFALLGSYLVSFPELKLDLTLYPDGLKGILFAILAAFFWGGSTVFGRRLLRKIEFKVMTELRLTFALVFLFLMILWQGELSTLVGLSSNNILFLIIITLVTGTGALLIYYKGLENTRASIATIAEMFWPFSAVIVNWIFLDLKLNLVQVLGGLILIFAIFMVSKENNKIKANQLNPNNEEKGMV